MIDPQPAGGRWEARLLGAWRLLRAESALELQPGTRLDFRTGGQLLYTIEVGGQARTFVLVWRVVDDQLETANPVDGHAMTASVSIGEADVLVLDFTGPRAWFVRELG